MPKIAIKTSRLPIIEKLAKGQVVISQSSDNPNVPGNEDLVAKLAAAQATLAAANAAFDTHQQMGQLLLSQRDSALVLWNAAMNNLAAFTDSITGGEPGKILTTGFDIYAPRSTPERVAQIEEVRVRLTSPGKSEVRWKRNPHADAYVVQLSPDPITDESWQNVTTVIDPQYVGNGTIPGQRYWFRIAGVNRLGQGPWSAPALRPVL